METQKLILAQNETVKPGTMWLLFLFLGWSYGSMGKIGKQIAYYLTFGGVGVWFLYRLFALSGAIRKHNNEVYLKYGLTDLIQQ